MATFVMAEIVRAIAKEQGPVERELRKAMINRATQIMNDAAKGMRKEFDKDPVTVELDGGVDAANDSGTLGGGAATDNLFSFIGFSRGSKPTEAIREMLDPSHQDGPKIQSVEKVPGNVPTYRAKIRSPNLDAIYARTPIPWAPDMSWAEKIETDIPGFAHFLAKPTSTPPSESGGGVQVKAELPSRAGSSFTPRPYLSKLFADFKTAIESFTRQRNR